MDEPTAQWDDPRVQAAYQILVSDEIPPPDQHWEGWAARRIVDALRSFAEEAVRLEREQCALECEKVRSVTAVSYETGSACAAAIRARSQEGKG